MSNPKPEDRDVHTEHCCIHHGCKYGKDPVCSVMTEAKRQSFPCEDCPPWRAEWPSKPGFYWFWGRTSRHIEIEPTMHLVAVSKVLKDDKPVLVYLYPAGELAQQFGAHGFWLPARLPDAPVMDLPEPEGVAKLRAVPKLPLYELKKLKLPTEILRLPIENGALTEVPVYEKHKRGRNWMAIIQPNPLAMGGWDRKWLTRARGKDYFYMVTDLFQGDVVEFGADYQTSMGRKDASRYYAVVAEVAPTHLDLLPFKTAKEAWTWRRENLRRPEDDS